MIYPSVISNKIIKQYFQILVPNTLSFLLVLFVLGKYLQVFVIKSFTWSNLSYFDDGWMFWSTLICWRSKSRDSLAHDWLRWPFWFTLRDKNSLLSIFNLVGIAKYFLILLEHFESGSKWFFYHVMIFLLGNSVVDQSDFLNQSHHWIPQYI